MKKYKIINGIIIMISFLLLGLIILDYGKDKIIPNFIFLNQFGLKYVTAYWAGIGTVIVLVPTIINLFLVRMEQVTNEYNSIALREQEKLNSIKHNLDRAIANLDFNNSDRQCIADIRDIEEAIDKQLLNPQVNTQSYGILLAEDLIIILAEYLHSLLKEKELCLRADARYLFRYLFSTNHIIAFCKNNTNISIAKFENEYIYSDIFTERNVYLFDKAKFENVIFNSTDPMCNGLVEQFIFNGFTIFNDCKFKLNDTIKIGDNSFLEFESCLFEKTISFVSGPYLSEHNSIIIKKSTFNQFTSFSHSKINYIKINECTFIKQTKLSDMHVTDIEIENSSFYGLFDMQCSIVDHVFRLINLVYNDSVLLWNTKLLSKYDIRIYGMKIEKKYNIMTNLNANILCENNEYKLDDYIRKIDNKDNYTSYEFDSNMLNSDYFD